MDEELYRLVSTGLLGLIVLLLILATVKLGKLGRGPQEESTPQGETTSEAATPASDRVQETAPSSGEAPAADSDGDVQGEVQGEVGDLDEGPFERDGRWWFRREGELLVYDERTDEWVDPNALEGRAGPVAEDQTEPRGPGSAEPMGVAVYDAPDPAHTGTESHPLDEAKGWDATPSTFAPIPEPVSPPEPITQFETGTDPGDIPEPIAQPEPGLIAQPEPHPTAQSEPEPEPVAQEDPGTEPAPELAPMAEGSGTHWKCPACGVINGSTATSCRMCFAARP